MVLVPVRVFGIEERKQFSLLPAISNLLHIPSPDFAFPCPVIYKLLYG